MGFWRDLWDGTETKTTVSPPINIVMASQYAPFLNPQEISPWMAWQLYKNASVVTRCVDHIADEVAGLEPQVRVDGNAVKEHPALEWLARPGFNRTRQRLIKELVVQYLVSGTAYPVVFGNVNVKGFPIAIDVMKSQFVNPIQGMDMWPSEYWYAEGTRSQTFTRDPSNPRDFRWIDGNGLSEIVPIYDMDGDRRGVGLPKLNAVKYDVELRMKGIQHNSSVLDNGARLSGVMSFKEALTEDQKADVTQQMKALAQGASNAGKVLIHAGGEADFTPLSQNMKDMDFAKLIQIVEDAVISRFSVPIAIFRIENASYNNYSTAFKMLYQMAVLPCFGVVYDGLAQIFTERLGQRIEIVPDELSNPVLADMALERSTKLSEHHLVSRNEARDIIGYEPVLGGDTIYGSISDVAQAEDYFTNHGVNDQEADNSQQAFHEARPEANPINQAGAEAEARAAGHAAGSPPEEGAGKPKPAAKKPAAAKPKAKAAKDKKSDEAWGTLIDFAERLQQMEAKGTKGKRKAPALIAAE